MIYDATGAMLLDTAHVMLTAAGKFGCCTASREDYLGRRPWSVEGFFYPRIWVLASLSHWHQVQGSMWNISRFLLSANEAIMSCNMWVT